MKHDAILRQLVADAARDPNQLGLLVFGSVAAGTHTESSDIDVISVLRTHTPSSGIENTQIDGIKVGTVFFTREVLVHSIATVPYLLHPIGEARLLHDREGTLQALLERIREFFADHPELVAEWNGYYDQFRREKAEFGFEKTTIVEVWDELEGRHSGGIRKRRFFTSPLRSME